MLKRIWGYLFPPKHYGDDIYNCPACYFAGIRKVEAKQQEFYAQIRKNA